MRQRGFFKQPFKSNDSRPLGISKMEDACLFEVQICKTKTDKLEVFFVVVLQLITFLPYKPKFRLNNILEHTQSIS